MKRILFLLSLSLVVLVLCNSCKKEQSCESCLGTNKLPLALAGPDQVISLPTDSVLLDGINSSDPDGAISNWLWKKISGPAAFVMGNSSGIKTVVKGLSVGSY